MEKGRSAPIDWAPPDSQGREEMMWLGTEEVGGVRSSWASLFNPTSELCKENVKIVSRKEYIKFEN